MKGEDACSADGFSSFAPLYLPSMFACLRVAFVFFSGFLNREDDEEAGLLGIGLLGICFDSKFLLFAGTKAMAEPILVSVYCCSLVLSVYYFFLWIYALFFLCSFLQFLVFRLSLASAFSSPLFCDSFSFYKT